MQAALNGAQGFELPMLWKRADRQYMMRSEKRPGYRASPGGNGGGGRRRRPGRHVGYGVLTIVLLLVLWPVGLFFLWARRLRWRSFVKAAVTVATGVAFLAGFSLLLTMQTQNDSILAFQRGFQDSMTYVSESAQYAKDHSDQYAVNASRIAASAADLSRKALLTVIPPAKRNMDALAAQSGKLAALVAEGAAGGFKQVLYDTGLAPTPSPSPTPTPAPTPTPTPEPTAEPSPPVEMVWYVPGEAVYHNDPTCGGLTGAMEIPLDEAQKMGLLPCPNCVVNAAPTGAAAITQSEAPAAEITPAASPEIAAKAVTPEESAAAPEDSLSPDATNAAASEASLPPEATNAATPQEPTLAAPSPSPSLAPEPTPTPLPTVAATPIPLPPAKKLGDVLVWHTEKGKYYHLNENCPGMSGAKQYTLASSVEAGFKPCPKCKPPAPELLKEDAFYVWCDSDHVFHITDDCSAMTDTYTVMTFDEAMLEQGYTGCPVCGADLYEQNARIPAVTPVPAEPMG